MFDNLITKMKSVGWGLKHAKGPKTVKRPSTAKTYLYAIFLRSAGQIMQISFINGRSVYVTFYKIVVLKTFQREMRKINPQPGLAT